ncbi:ATP-binding cassette subfamily F protein 3 [Bacillus mesophilus]|uniref:ABC-F family ATP-binding cassette domain-containing protein n=1 Tax=Bacillus mesophilus TaxID=1808955 RepID=A0A6M0QCK1_9BACI|nr:ABC-F family ATP-binding cassette domain-containing protein [Bacillus mesophilus]MBM7663311.1 ATP-binding cassette subfamily F protein 3 [Bacillus mesophilus]NEY74093.1 ABC-F family ATP-binding cassette domain-containing protein [Bacillus mesophilus]
MIVLQLNQITKFYGSEPILSNIKLEVQSKDRIALVGRNGAGKSTLLKIIAGIHSQDSGEIIKPKDVTIGYLEQHTGLETRLSIWEELLTVFSHLKRQEKELRLMEEQMGDPALFQDQPRYERILKEYDIQQEQFKQQGGYQYESDIRSILHGLGFANFDINTPISTLSGGQKTRLALGKLLLSKPDLLILDEPTNHLDMDTLSWLEQYLNSYPGAILIVSHDRYFLDKVVSQVYELARTHMNKYHGNYSQYLVQKAENYERELRQYEKQQEEVSKLKDFIQRNIARASTTKRAQSRRKQLDRMTLMDRPNGDEKSASFHFDINRQSGNIVLKVEDLAISYEDHEPTIKNINFTLNREDSVALIGPNGIGKSSLLKGIISKLNPSKGSIHFGSNVTIGYYDQEQANLKSNKRVLNELWDDYPHVPEKEIRTVLGNFLFSGDDVLKEVSSLSGGEKARLALSKLMMQKANFLILDEPTNHLDLDSKEILENALIDYPGTILFVSHDRYFINRISSKVLELEATAITEYLGDYDYFLEKKQMLAELQELEAKVVKPSQESVKAEKRSFEEEKELKRLERQRKRRIEEIEKEIASLEELIAHNDEQLCDPEVYQDHEIVQKLNHENDQANEQLEKLMHEWEHLLEQE